MRYFLLNLLCLSYGLVSAQQTYVDQRDQTQLCGPIDISAFKSKPYDEWFKSGYNNASFDLTETKWKKNLKNVQVEIFLGTWCGDSKNWVPKFVKLWDELGLDPTQLTFVGLYNTEGQYKKGPNSEEKGKNIHRVPTFIFTENNKEVGRIVEFPINDLKTDVAQIALGYPSLPNYRAANYLLDLFTRSSIEEINQNIQTHFRHIYKEVKKANELNSLGYLLMRHNRLEEALVAFHLNTYLFRQDANVYDSYAEGLMALGKWEESLKFYEKTLEMNPENENAVSQIKILKSKIETEG